MGTPFGAKVGCWPPITYRIPKLDHIAVFAQGFLFDTKVIF